MTDASTQSAPRGTQLWVAKLSNDELTLIQVLTPDERRKALLSAAKGKAQRLLALGGKQTA